MNAFIGGTRNSEECVFTGLHAPAEPRRNVDSYIRYFNNEGYYTEGGHPYLEKFYNRMNSNKYYGFNEYYYLENRYADFNKNRDYLYYPIADKPFFDDICTLFDERDISKPYLGYFVTYQGHGPYSNEDLSYSFPEDKPKDDDSYFDADFYPGLSVETSNILNNYLASVKDTGDNLYKLAEKLSREDEPIVLVIYGDHKPWCGINNSGYDELSVDLEPTSLSGLYNRSATDYLIWANDPAKAITGNDFRGEGPTISACYLMSLVFRECGYKGDSYMQHMTALMDKIPVMHSDNIFITNNKLTTDLSGDALDLYNEQLCMEYYRNYDSIVN